MDDATVGTLRAQSASAAPSRANSSAAARPIPLLPPVMTTVLPSKIPTRSTRRLRHIAKCGFAMHAASDGIDCDDVARCDACEIDVRTVTLGEQSCAL